MVGTPFILPLLCSGALFGLRSLLGVGPPRARILAARIRVQGVGQVSAPAKTGTPPATSGIYPLRGRIIILHYVYIRYYIVLYSR